MNLGQGEKCDAFICHASEDKDQIAKPLASAITNAGMSCWLDEAKMRWGDDLSAMINDGLSNSRYVIVILTPFFIEKNWTLRELNSAITKEVEENTNHILPVVSTDPEIRKAIFDKLPLIRSKIWQPWASNPEVIAQKLSELLISDS